MALSFPTLSQDLCQMLQWKCLMPVPLYKSYFLLHLMRSLPSKRLESSLFKDSSGGIMQPLAPNDSISPVHRLYHENCRTTGVTKSERAPQHQHSLPNSCRRKSLTTVDPETSWKVYKLVTTEGSVARLLWLWTNPSKHLTNILKLELKTHDQDFTTAGKVSVLCTVRKQSL